MRGDLTQGNVMKTMLRFAVPMILGNLLQQCYNVADTLIVGRFLGAGALAAVGSSFTLMTFLTSILLGLCMGSGAVFSIRFGQQNHEGLKECMCASFALIAALTVALNLLAFAGTDAVIAFLKVPQEIQGLMEEYLLIIFCGIAATFLYNYFASLLRAVGNSLAPLIFLAVSAVLNIVLDLWFVLGLGRGVAGAALATVIAQYVSGIGIALYTWRFCPYLRVSRRHCRVKWRSVREIAGFSILTCLQQSVMNFGILMIQGLINSFGTAVMAAYAAAVKIDSFAYMPAQEFSNSFSIFTSQNYGAKDEKRVKEGVRAAVKTSLIFCGIVSVLIFLFARPLMLIFVKATEVKVLQIGVQYLRIEGAFYCGIGLLFLLYAYYRGTGKPEMSVVLTVISLGTRVLLAYTLAPLLGVRMIWWAIIIGWFLADITGVLYMKKKKI